MLTSLCIFFVGSSLVAGQANPVLNCPSLPPHTPANVHDVAPGDLEVIMALGDSITAGFGLMGLDGGLDEFRDQSHAIGNTGLTLGTFFQYYNPNLFGMSTGSHLVELPGDAYYPTDMLNAAQSNAVAENFPYQVKHLLSVLQQNNINTSAFKLLNVLIGANDACPLCGWTSDRPTPEQAADAYETALRNMINLIETSLPNTIINFMPMFNVSGVYWLSLDKTYCEAVHVVLPFECPCAFDSDEANRNYLDSVLQAYDDRIASISEDYKQQNLPHLAVIYQPLFRNIYIPSLPITYLSTLDCFHPSQLCHQQLATENWNSLLQPFAQKPLNITIPAVFQCPTAASRIFTD